MEIVPVIIGCLGGGVEQAGGAVTKLFEEEGKVIKIMRTMLQTVLMEGETIIRKVLSGVIQPE